MEDLEDVKKVEEAVACERSIDWAGNLFVLELLSKISNEFQF